MTAQPTSPSDRPQVARSPKRVIGLAGALVPLAIGAGVLAFWLLRAPLALDGSFVWLMKANTALCVICLALGMLRLADPSREGAGHLRRLLAGLVLAIGVATLVEYAAGVELGFDTLLAADPSPSFPGRMSPWTAALLALLAIALLAHGPPRFDRIADAALLGAGVCLQLVAAGYLYGVVGLYGVDRLTRVSPQTLLCLTALWVALIAGRLGRGVLEIATRPTPGGAAVRMLLPIALILPPLLGWLRLLLQWEGMIDTSHGVALFAVAQTLVLAALVYGFAIRLDRAEARYLAERQRREGLERLVAICAWTGRVRFDGQWVRVEQYLAERWGVEVTHTISEEAMQRMEEEIADMDALRSEEES